MRDGCQRLALAAGGAGHVIARLPVPVQRWIYRVGFVVVWLASELARPRTRGVKCVVVHGDDVLLVRHTYGSRQWDLSGGFCGRGEAFADSARREVVEELGVAIVGLTDIGEEQRGLYGRHETLHLFRVEVGGRELTLARGEIAEARWCSRDDLPLPRAEIVDVALARERDAAGEAALPGAS